MKQTNQKKSRKIFFFVIECMAAVMVLVGALIVIYPFISSYMMQKEDNRQIAQFEQGAGVGDDALYPGLYKALKEYNETIYAQGQPGLSVESEYASFAVDVAPYHLPRNMIGYIEIPTIKLKMPVYLGASETNMENGATVLGGSSAPIGGTNTNCVIPAHNNWKGASRFQKTEKLKVGDKIYLHNPWETLTYAVTSSKVINESDIQAVRIEEGKDKITLSTCYPFYAWHPSTRFLVYGERVVEE